MKREFEGIVSDWSEKNRPKFVIRTTVSRKALRCVVRPYARRKASDIFHWVDAGTRPYTIRPKRSNRRGRLAFRLGYLPKTMPIVQAHVGPGRASGPWVFPTEVHHPGIRARRFSETVQERTDKQFRGAIENAFRRISRRLT